MKRASLGSFQAKRLLFLESKEALLIFTITCFSLSKELASLSVGLSIFTPAPLPTETKERSEHWAFIRRCMSLDCYGPNLFLAKRFTYWEILEIPAVSHKELLDSCFRAFYGYQFGPLL